MSSQVTFILQNRDSIISVVKFQFMSLLLVFPLFMFQYYIQRDKHWNYIAKQCFIVVWYGYMATLSIKHLFTYRVCGTKIHKNIKLVIYETWLKTIPYSIACLSSGHHVFMFRKIKYVWKYWKRNWCESCYDRGKHFQ